MRITSPNSGHSLEWQDVHAVAIGEELTPLLIELPPRERIAALAYQIALAARELDGMPDHACLDSVTADLMGQVVTQICAAGLKAQRQAEAEMSGRFSGGSDSGVREAYND